MVEVIKQTKNIQKTGKHAPHVYLDRKFLEVMGMGYDEPVEIEYDFHQGQICIRKASDEPQPVAEAQS